MGKGGSTSFPIRQPVARSTAWSGTRTHLTRGRDANVPFARWSWTTRRGPAWAPGWPTGLARPPARPGWRRRAKSPGRQERQRRRVFLASALPPQTSGSDQPASGRRHGPRPRPSASFRRYSDPLRAAGRAYLLANAATHLVVGFWTSAFFSLPFSALPSCFSRSTRRGWTDGYPKWRARAPRQPPPTRRIGTSEPGEWQHSRSPIRPITQWPFT